MTIQNGTLDLETTTYLRGAMAERMAPSVFRSGTFVNFASTANIIVGNAVLLFVNNSFNAASSPQVTINTGGFLDMLDNVATVNSLAGGGTAGVEPGHDAARRRGR